MFQSQGQELRDRCHHGHHAQQHLRTTQHELRHVSHTCVSLSLISVSSGSAASKLLQLARVRTHLSYLPPSIPDMSSLTSCCECSYLEESRFSIDPNTEKPYVFWVTRTYNPISFLLTFYSFDFPNLEGEADAPASCLCLHFCFKNGMCLPLEQSTTLTELCQSPNTDLLITSFTAEFLESQGFNPREQFGGTFIERLKVGCVDMPTKRQDSQEVLDDTLFCGWIQVCASVVTAHAYFVFVCLLVCYLAGYRYVFLTAHVCTVFVCSLHNSVASNKNVPSTLLHNRRTNQWAKRSASKSTTRANTAPLRPIRLRSISHPPSANRTSLLLSSE